MPSGAQREKGMSPAYSRGSHALLYAVKGTRTLTPFQKTDFESVASTDSAIPAEFPEILSFPGRTK